MDGNQRMIDLIKRRRSVRRYTAEQIPDEALKTILECGLYAPSGRGCQYSRFIVIQDPDVMERLNGMIRDELAGREMVPGSSMCKGIARARQEGYHFIHHAPTLINVVSPRDHDNSMANCACALMNMQLAASALGVASCWSNQLHWLTDVPEIRKVLATFGLREDEDVFGSLSLGFAAADPGTPAPRRKGRVQFDTIKTWEL